MRRELPAFDRAPVSALFSRETRDAFTEYTMPLMEPKMLMHLIPSDAAFIDSMRVRK